MGFDLYDKNGNIITQHNLQDKGSWCIHGLSKEESFIEKFGQHFGVLKNPAKLVDKFAPDLFDWRDNRLADLKTQNTPFFTSGRYNVDPQLAVTFNLKDVKRYRSLYPEIDIYFWLDWIAVRWGDIEVQPMEAVYFIPFHILLNVVQTAPIHSYLQRKTDTMGNAKDSYVLDLNDCRFTRIF
jgi:hypothetical protein